MRFQLIGPFQIVGDDGRSLPLGTPKVSQILALLLTHANSLVSPDTCIQELWQHSPPRSALNTVQTYVHHARRVLTEDARRPETGEPLVTTRFGGYMLRVDESAIDVKVFERLVARGRGELRAGRCEAAAETLAVALDLWRGPALANVPTGDVLTGRVVHLEELRIRALELRVEAVSRLGRLRELVPELRTLVHDYPLNEWFHGQLIAALHQAGRRAEALEAYRQVRRILQDELGLEPSPEVQWLHQRVLSPPRMPPAPPAPAVPEPADAVRAGGPAGGQEGVVVPLRGPSSLLG
ncbi:AfsR/SARP family transcriptional regulator [Streptomyces omiyaensis]|uniref:BTAD domain-containing putative transcriptional regulator n=1 Tax=Streptomyces omiyaensis TaxID=68247 RepID=A0ABW7C3X4_9ACTN|nr:AfsR/SARP family transcriptional regulator [Streptomyces omiyaensis]